MPWFFLSSCHLNVPTPQEGEIVTLVGQSKLHKTARYIVELGSLFYFTTKVKIGDFVKISKISSDFSSIIMKSLLNLPQQWIDVTYTYVCFIVSLFCSHMPNCHSPLVSIRCLRMAVKVFPYLSSNHNLANPNHITSSLPTSNSVCFVHIKLLFYKLGMFILKSLEQFPLPKMSHSVSPPFQQVPSLTQTPPGRLLSLLLPYGCFPMNVYLNGNLWLFLSHHLVLLST